MCTLYEESYRLNNLDLDNSFMCSFSNLSVSPSLLSVSLKRKPSFVCSKRK